MCSRRVHRSCSTCDNRRVPHVSTNKSNSVDPILGKGDGIVVTTFGTYPLSPVKQIFNKGQPTLDVVPKNKRGEFKFTT